MQADVGAAVVAGVVAELELPCGRSSNMFRDAYVPPGFGKGSNLSKQL
jgi:hypothetical protein